MTWLAQAVHVARKDLRLTKWSLLLYLAGVALLTILALLGVAIWGQLLWAGALCVAGGLLLGMFVHADSPTRVDAFWATRPLSTSAVYAAKVMGTNTSHMCAVTLGLLNVGESSPARSSVPTASVDLAGTGLSSCTRNQVPSETVSARAARMNWNTRPVR